MKTFTLCGLASASLAALVLVPAARALQTTQSATVGGGTASLATDFDDGFNHSFSLFDAAAISAANQDATVTLNDVILTFTAPVSAGGSLRNTGSNSQNFSFDVTIGSYLGAGTTTGAGADAQAIVIDQFGPGTFGSITQNFGTRNYSNVPAGSTVTYPDPSSATPRTLSASSSATLMDSTSLSAFVGTGTFDLNELTSTSKGLSGGGGNITSTVSTDAGGTFALQYDYTLAGGVPSVPEPSTWALLGASAGVGLLSFVARRRRTGVC